MSIRRLSERALLLLALGATVAAAPAAARAAPSPASSTPDPMADYRERFKLGMERFKAGALADAIAYWEPIYREMGEEKGYRLAYNLGVAYMEFKDATRAAERLQAFLDQVDARRGRGETIDKHVIEDESDARERMSSLQSTKGRIQVGRGTTPISAQVDADQPRLAGFVAWVTPGDHSVMFDPGAPDAEQRHVTVQAGQVIEVNPTPPPAPSASVAPAGGADAGAPLPSESTTAPPQIVTHEVTHPFAPALTYVTGGLAAAAAIALVPLNYTGWRKHDGYNPTGANATQDANNYYGLRTAYYVDMGAAVVLGVATAALVTWYFLGKEERDVIVTPAGVSGRF